MRWNFDLSVYLVTDEKVARQEGRTVLGTVWRALLGGATFVQLRDKFSTDEEIIQLGRQLLAFTRWFHVPLVVNDRVDVALAIGADGVHIGQGDMPARDTRRLIGYNRILGVSVCTVEQAVRAQHDGADYIGIGPVFPTRTKCDADDPIGLERLAEIAYAVRIPTVAIGGISHANAARIMDQGVDGVAVVSAIAAQTDPVDATRRLRQVIGC